MLTTIPSMIAATMEAVDITIANVALPHMQASLSASQEQVLWVPTSCLVAGAIATPISGWLARRAAGRAQERDAGVGGRFHHASAMCGLATDLRAIVIARFLQGAWGAALVPLSQAILLIRQSTMVGNISIYHFVFVLTLAVMPLVLLLLVKKSKLGAASLVIGE